MAPLRILICGGGPAGLSLASWLTRLRHNITVVERFPRLREEGQQIDLRGQGVKVMKMMGIENELRAKVVDEDGMLFVDTTGKSQAFIAANKTGKGAQTGTSEWEILRGDLCRVIYDPIKDKVKSLFGIHVTNFQQDESGVQVQFSDGTEDAFDLVVGADGQTSRTRRILLGSDAPDPFHSFGIYSCYFNAPQKEGDRNVGTLCHIPGRRLMVTRKNNPHTIQCYFGSMMNGDKFQHALKQGPAEQKAVFAETFQGTGWESQRLIDGLSTTKEFYAHEIGQVRLDRWSKGRVALLGDAAFGPSTITGMGTSSALVGAYVLAGEISKHCKDGPDGIPAALDAYESRFRPFMDKVQDVSGLYISMMFPNRLWHIRIAYFVTWLMTSLRVDRLLTRFMSDDVKGWDIPEYPDLRPEHTLP
jgi:2-polyprenyl-6-methoxyphenol hydroxylase-like FAD-dependent oxidoreductase